MKIAVIGAGVIGLTSAYELALEGHKVSIFEKESAAATISSFANSGLLSPSLNPYLSHPLWSSAGWLARFRDMRNLKIGWKLTLNDLRWYRKWKNTDLQSLTQNAAINHALIEAGKQRLHAIAAAEKFDFEQTAGQLVLISSEVELARVREKLAILKSWGVVANEIAPGDISKIEPGFHPPSSLLCAVYFPDDEVGNCRQFALSLKKVLERMGVEFNFNAPVVNIHSSPDPQILVQGNDIQQHFDHVVICTGTNIQTFPDAMQIPVPVVSIASYSLTLRVEEDINAPRSAVYIAHNHTSIVRMGKRIRVNSGTELGTHANHRSSKAIKYLYQALQQAFPGGADYSSSAQVWKGTIAVTADGLPVIGAGKQRGVWLNLGHGPNGWGMACGAAMCISAAIGKSEACIDLRAVSPQRN